MPSQKVESGTQLVCAAGSTIREIVAGVHHVTNVISEISDATTKQSASISNVNKGVAQLDQNGAPRLNVGAALTHSIFEGKFISGALVEATIGGMESDGLLDRNWRMDALGDAMHAFRSGAGPNLRMILAHLRVPYVALVAQLVLLLLITAPSPHSSRRHASI